MMRLKLNQRELTKAVQSGLLPVTASVIEPISAAEIRTEIESEISSRKGQLFVLSEAIRQDRYVLRQENEVEGAAWALTLIRNSMQEKKLRVANLRRELSLLRSIIPWWDRVGGNHPRQH